MYKLKKLIFGWDYIYCENSMDSGVARVFFTHDGRVAYWQYSISAVLKIVSTKEQVVWLTCKPSKFRL